MLLDVAAHELAKVDGRSPSVPFDVIDPDGKTLLTAGRIVREGGEGMEGERGGVRTIGSEKLGGASVLVRRTR